MRIQAVINKVEVKKFMAYDSKTGAPDPGYILQATVTDMDTSESSQCQLNEGFGLEQLREARKLKAPEADRDAIAAQVEAAAKQLEGQQLQLVVGKPRAKGFVTFPIISMQ
jgi:acyl CoA:acetate/3-ketoacid CoA transferase alpha subunit